MYYIKECPLKIGDLVLDVNPYKAPEVLYGHGVVVIALNENYVMVHWTQYNIVEAVDIGNLEVLSTQ
jgi:hypothetical protein